jgi:quercetin dioxygenase-like cupin family protein
MADEHTVSSGATGIPAGSVPAGDGSADPVPHILFDLQALGTLLPAPAGALWRLEESGRQLDANVVHLPPRQRVDTHAEPDLDVLLLVLTGDGTLTTTDGPQHLATGALTWLPRGSTRSLTAGTDGLSYLTVHRRRPGMQIRSRS